MVLSLEKTIEKTYEDRMIFKRNGSYDEMAAYYKADLNDARTMSFAAQIVSDLSDEENRLFSVQDFYTRCQEAELKLQE